ncbi:hypothetical protein GDO78_007128 [Eleutherodactylus coqui]|uniref:Uncharacterized protein n=1 Tax=Eleutherodactylus coqui TaxID=57060 RepID=A0A8J6FGC0_ELECQ|nr:hypothetical protein GDO78_007128 [Eleutherodactylus coqui]
MLGLIICCIARKSFKHKVCLCSYVETIYFSSIAAETIILVVSYYVYLLFSYCICRLERLYFVSWALFILLLWLTLLTKP